MGVCESFFPCCIRIEMSEGTLPMISKLGIKENSDSIFIGHGGPGAHFSPGVTIDIDLIRSISLGLSSSSILMEVSLFTSN